jgi:hypothetical protein
MRACRSADFSPLRRGLRIGCRSLPKRTEVRTPVNRSTLDISPQSRDAYTPATRPSPNAYPLTTRSAGGAADPLWKRLAPGDGAHQLQLNRLLRAVGGEQL